MLNPQRRAQKTVAADVVSISKRQLLQFFVQKIFQTIIVSTMICAVVFVLLMQYILFVMKNDSGTTVDSLIMRLFGF